MAQSEASEVGPTGEYEPRRDRRSFLSAVAGGLAALGLRNIAAARPAEAADGQGLLIGRQNAATSETALNVTQHNGGVGLLVATDKGYGVAATTLDPVLAAVAGTSGTSGGIGMNGLGTTGVPFAPTG